MSVNAVGKLTFFSGLLLPEDGSGSPMIPFLRIDLRRIT